MLLEAECPVNKMTCGIFQGGEPAKSVVVGNINQKA